MVFSVWGYYESARNSQAQRVAVVGERVPVKSVAFILPTDLKAFSFAEEPVRA
ncbi:hypothetical protein PA39016_003090069 [Pseudomonas aeruginosa 39016]|nr:hypothetical protein PA39016_003090069 [Pseudomonas aeruginosa 39016]